MRLNIAMDNAIFMGIIKGFCYFSNNLNSSVNYENTVFKAVLDLRKRSSINVFHDDKAGA
ncbi:MAG TPA: hypothetical protein PLS31_07375 [Candidatus Sumerlaeota bacterium]|nr:hypothetical protein [Candidatus Sumerlaeota bacterium]